MNVTQMNYSRKKNYVLILLRIIVSVVCLWEQRLKTYWHVLLFLCFYVVTYTVHYERTTSNTNANPNVACVLVALFSFSMILMTLLKAHEVSCSSFCFQFVCSKCTIANSKNRTVSNLIKNAHVLCCKYNCAKCI